MASMQRRTAKPGSVGSRHKAAASRLRSLQDVIGQHCPRVANICSMIGKSRCCSEYSVLNLLLSISGANLGPGTVISVSPLHTWQINGIRHWTCTAAPSNSNKSGAYAFFESCQSEAEAALQNRGFQVFRDGTKIGLIDPSRNAEAMFKHLSMRHDYTGLSLMEEGKKLVDQLACTKGPGAGLSADFRANLLTQRDGSRIAMATQSEPNRQIPYSNRTIAMMIQTEFLDQMFLDNSDGLFSRFNYCIVSPIFDQLSTFSDTDVWSAVEPLVANNRVEVYRTELLGLCRVSQPPALQFAIEETPQEDYDDDDFRTARDGAADEGDGDDEEEGDDDRDSQEDTEEEDPEPGEPVLKGILPAMATQLLVDCYSLGHTMRDNELCGGVPKTVKHVFHLATEIDVQEYEAGTGGQSTFKVYKEHHDQVQQDLQLLYCEGHISRCGPFGKSKVAIMETALLLHVLEHFLHHPMHKPPSSSRLPRSKPAHVVSPEAMKAAIALSRQEMEQLTLFSEVFAPLANTSVFAHLLPTAVEAGIISGASSSGSAAAGQIVPTDIKKIYHNFLTHKAVTGEMIVDSSGLASKKTRLFVNKEKMHQTVDLITSGKDGLPVLGVNKTNGSILKQSVKVVFEKLYPTTAEGLQDLVKQLNVVGVQLQEYLPAAKLQELHTVHKLDIPGLDEAALLQLAGDQQAQASGSS